MLQKIDYITYLSNFDHLFEIPKERKNSEYRKYLHILLDYLHVYLQRVKPILDLNTEVDSVLKEFQIQWENGTFPGWPVSIFTFNKSPYCNIFLILDSAYFIFGVH